MLTLFAQAATFTDSAPWAVGSATVILAGVVVWLAKAYRDDGKEQRKECALERKEDRVEYRASLKEIRDSFTEAMDEQNQVLSGLCDSVKSLHCHRHQVP